MAFPLRPDQMEIGKHYDLTDTPDGPAFFRVEKVAPRRGEDQHVVRLLEDRRGAAGEVVLPKGSRIELDPAVPWSARLEPPSIALAATYPTAELFKKRVNVERATKGKEYAFLLPGVERLDPSSLFFATLVDAKVSREGFAADPPMRLTVRVAPEVQEAWGLDTPVLEWEAVSSHLPIFEIPETRTRQAFAKNLALMNVKAKLPIELLGEVMKFAKPTFKGGPYPGKERQAAYWRAEHERQSQDAVAAMKAGRRKTRKTRRRKTRRRN